MRAFNSQLTERLYAVEQRRRALIGEVLAEIKFNLSQWMALCTLARNGGSGMTDLAEASALDRTSLTRTIDSLILRGLVVRYTPPKDRRTVMVEATPEGLALAARTSLEIDALESDWLAELTSDAQARLAADLETLLQGSTGPGRLRGASSRRNPTAGRA